MLSLPGGVRSPESLLTAHILVYLVDFGSSGNASATRVTLCPFSWIFSAVDKPTTPAVVKHHQSFPAFPVEIIALTCANNDDERHAVDIDKERQSQAIVNIYRHTINGMAENRLYSRVNNFGPDSTE